MIRQDSFFPRKYSWYLIMTTCVCRVNFVDKMLLLFLWWGMFAENDEPKFWKKGLSNFHANLSDWWLRHLLWNYRQTNVAGPRVPWHWCMMCLFSFLPTSSYMRQVTQFIDVPIRVAEKSPGLHLLKNFIGSMVINLAVNLMPLSFSENAHLKTLEPSSAAGSHFHYSDVMMSVMVSQITSISSVCPTVCSGTDQRKHQSSASLAFVRGIHRWPVNSLHKWPVTWKMFPFVDVIMLCVQWISLRECLYFIIFSG